MTTLINKESTQHYANKMVLAENRKVGSKSLPTALNEIDALIDEMKTYFDAEYDSALDMKLENNKNVFSVGTGTNIDKRSEVENSFTDVELSGNSLVNVCPLEKGTTVVRSKNAIFQPIMKPNTTYTLISSTSNSSFDSNKWGAIVCITYPSLSPDYIALGGNAETSIVNGYKIQEFTTKAEPVKTFEFSVHADNSITETNLYILDYAILLEGRHTTNPPQYFEGMKSVGQDDVNGHKIEILSRNKNLFVEDLINETGTGNAANGNLYPSMFKYSNTRCRTKNPIKVKPNTTYYFSSNDKFHFAIAEFDKDNKQILENGWTIEPQGGIHTTSNNCVSIVVVIKKTDNSEITSQEIYGNIQIEEGTLKTTYIEPKLNKKEISLNEPLRGLPNGVRDTIEKINGEWKIVRRTGETVLDGTEFWNPPGDGNVKNGTTKMFARGTRFEPLDNNNINLISDNFCTYKGDDIWNKDNEGISINVNGTLHIRIKTSRLSEVTGNGLANWLKQNPIRIVYKLATPIIEDISPITLQCWKNGVISIGDVLPVETNHTVALNKSAQIKNNIKELTTLRKRVEDLESFYDKAALEQAYQLDLINHSYELDYNR